MRDTLLLDTANPGPLDLARLEAALNAASDAFFDVDLSARTIRWSRGIELLLGHDPERLGADLAAWQGLIHPDDAETVLESGRHALPSGASVWSHELRLARADGSHAPVRVRAFVVFDGERPSHVVGAVTDLSEVRERERELRALNEELAERTRRERRERLRRNALLRAPRTDILVDWDPATGACSWSPDVATVLGWSAEELADTESVLRHAHPEDGPRALADLQRHIAVGAPSWSGRFRWLPRDGDELVIEGRGEIVRDETGRPLAVIGTVVRFTDQRHRSRAPGAPILTARQRQVLKLLPRGHTNKEIAERLGISEQAAKVQVSKLLRKFGVQNRAALAAIAAEHADLG